MAIVKIFPNDPKKSDFSIRFFATKFHLFEGDKILRSNLKSVEEAESEMNKIVAERIKANLTEVKVIHNGFDPELKELTPHKRIHTYALKNCVICGEEFKSIRSNNVFCSTPCANSMKARKMRENKKQNSELDKKDSNNEEALFPSSIIDQMESLSSVKIPHSEENQKEFDNLRKEAIHDKKRENFISELFDCIANQVKYEIDLNGACDWDSYYKTLLRLNVVFYNNANMFLAIDEIFGIDAYKKPIVLSSILSEYTLEKSKETALKFMKNMNTFPSHAQHSALASLSLTKPFHKQMVALNGTMKAIQKENVILYNEIAEKSKIISDLAEQVRTVSNDNKNIWEIINSKDKTPDPFNREEPKIRDYVFSDEVVGIKPKKKSWFKWFNW